MRVAILTGWLFLAGAQAQTPVKPFTQYVGEELLHAFPELAGMQFAAGQRSNVRHSGIDAATGRISRLRVELLEQIANFPFETLSTDVVFVPVVFRGSGRRILAARASDGSRPVCRRRSAHRTPLLGLQDMGGRKRVVE